ncbi:MAG TPA: hypothetical protein VJU86_16445 [Pyrinomonadaceae bacterium]|nr:hypothetical protein [Pyrinomonadaceae bacterium]
MNEKPMTKAVARRFLLGAVDDSEREQIETLFMIDPETSETILIAEDELVEDYLEGSLSESEAAQFLDQYAQGPRQRRKLRIANSIREYAQAEALRDSSGTSALQKLRSFISPRLPRERWMYLPIAAVVASVVVVTAIWLVQWDSQRRQENKLRLAIEQQLSELNAPANLRENPPQMLSLIIPSVSLRSMSVPAEIMPQGGYRVIELQLLWPQKEEFPSYRALLRRVGGSEAFTVSNLRAEKNPSGKVVRLRLPAQTLARGLYHVTLSAISTDGSSGPTEEYDFMIGG